MGEPEGGQVFADFALIKHGQGKCQKEFFAQCDPEVSLHISSLRPPTQGELI